MIVTTLEKTGDAEVSITGVISAERLAEHKKNVLRALSERISVDGFRKGHIPERVIIEKVGNESVLEEAAEKALRDEYPLILKEKNIDAIGRPEITITKLADGNPLEFRIKTAVMPAITLPDYKKIAREHTAKKEEVPTVSDEEVARVLEETRKRKAIMDAREQKTSVSEIEMEPKLPELDDAFARSLGSFKNFADLKEKIRDGIAKEKEHKAREKRRLEILDDIAKDVVIALPKILIENELSRMLYDLKARTEDAGIPFPDYLIHIKKTELELREAWEVDARKRVLTHFILDTIAKKERIAVPAEEIDRETEKIASYYPDAGKKEGIRHNVESLLTYEKIYQILEGNQ